MRNLKARPKHRSTAIVVGGDRGQGAEIAKLLGGSGVNIIIPFISTSYMANEVVVEIETKRGYAIAIFADIRDEAHIEVLFSAGISAFGSVDMVVHSPAVTTAVEPAPGMISLNESLTILRKVAALLPSDGRIVDLTLTDFSNGDGLCEGEGKPLADDIKAFHATVENKGLNLISLSQPRHSKPSGGFGTEHLYTTEKNLMDLAVEWAPRLRSNPAQILSALPIVAQSMLL